MTIRKTQKKKIDACNNATRGSKLVVMQMHATNPESNQLHHNRLVVAPTDDPTKG